MLNLVYHKKMEIREITNKSAWEEFLAECKEKTFLQSWNWGEFQEKMGNKIWRIGVYENENLLGVALISKIKARRGTFLLIQHGPVLAFNKKDTLEFFVGELKKIGKKEKASFIRISPLWERNEENQNTFKNLGFRESPMHANAYEASWKLDITLPEEELLSNMRKTTRYLIRQAQKNTNVVIEKSNNLDNLKIYQELNEKVAKRQDFVPFSYEYIKNEFEVFSKDNQCLWFFGKYEGEIAAAALVVFWSGIGFYHQAASDYRFAKFSIPYLIQWEAIREAKSRGFSLYDFWGFVDPQKNHKHPWAGPTLFKMGYGGKAYEYIKTQDLPLSKKYWLTYIFEKVRKAKRGL